MLKVKTVSLTVEIISKSRGVESSERVTALHFPSDRHLRAFFSLADHVHRMNEETPDKKVSCIRILRDGSKSLVKHEKDGKLIEGAGLFLEKLLVEEGSPQHLK